MPGKVLCRVETEHGRQAPIVQPQYAFGVIKPQALRHVRHGQFQPARYLAYANGVGGLPIAFPLGAAAIGLVEHDAAKGRTQDQHGDEGDGQSQPAAIEFAIGAEREAPVETGGAHGREVHLADGQGQQDRAQRQPLPARAHGAHRCQAGQYHAADDGRADHRGVPDDVAAHDQRRNTGIVHA